MSKFKVEDKAILIKTNGIADKGFQIGDEVEIKGISSGRYEYVIEKKMYIGYVDGCQLELVEEPIKTTELKIDSNEIVIRNSEIRFNEEKEGNKMIESMNLIDLYANKHKESIEKETKEKVEELRKNCDVINKYNELVEQFEKDCDELYLSQFTEEEKAKTLSDVKELNDVNKQLQRKFGNLSKYVINDEFTTEDIINAWEEMARKKFEIDELVKMVKAHVGIAKTKEEVEEILTRYGIIDKKGKLVTK